jgi:hypothetical protein
VELDSVRELKQALTRTVLASLTTQKVMVRTLAIAAGSTDAVHRTLALGVAPKGTNDFQLAVRLQRPELQNSPMVDQIRRQARGEVDVRYIGQLSKQAAIPLHQKRNRPLRIGGSIGHYKITAGTLGCFVRSRGDGAELILSNNHVLANENKAKPGDEILQPGTLDGGKRPDDVIGELARFVKLKRVSANLVDCAVASIRSGIKYNYKDVDTFGKLAGLGFADLDGKVSKIGRTTGPTHGVITAFELDNIVVGYGMGDLTFNSQIEIEGAGTEPFSAGGDSGSLIFDADLKGIALLFAGGTQGGTNNKGLAYANPLKSVLDALKVDLVY